MRRTIVEDFLQSGINFAVCVNVKSFIGVEADKSSQDYFIIVKKADAPIRAGFKKSEDYPDIMERDLTSYEIDRFKDNLSSFVKVSHNQHGRVYELKNKSFKEYYGSY